MKIKSKIKKAATVFLFFAILSLSANAETNSAVRQIDLPTALRLAGAQNLDVRIAREQLNEARAKHEQARLRFFPWSEPGVGYRRHDGNIQEVGGSIFDASKQSYTAGASLNARVELGEAIYQSLAAKQLVRAAEEGAEAVRQETALAAASGYFELARAKASAGVARDAVRIAEEYANQVERAVEAGIAFKGDAHRAAAAVERNRILLRQAAEQQRVAAARLAQVLRLDPAVMLEPKESELAPMILTDTNTALAPMVERALASRPDLRRFEAAAGSAQTSSDGAKYGPLVPTLGAQANFYGLGGGRNDALGNFDDGQDYFVGLNWRIGPGGLFDRGRTRAAEARAQTSRLEMDKARDEVTRQVIEARTRAESLADQVALSHRAMAAAEETLKLSRERKEFGVGAVLETVQAEEEFTRARLDYLQTVAAHNQAQFALRRAVGDIANGPMRE